MGQVNKESKRQGRGAFAWNEGTTFVVYWENGLKKKGKFFYSDGKIFFNGEFKNCIKHQNGTQMFKDGSKLIG